MTGITVTRIDDRLVAVKRGDPDHLDRLRREAETLAALDHPGLVQLLELTDGDPIELHTRFVGPDSWDRRPPTGDADVVAGLAGVAATLADLHDLGTAHGSVSLGHVITATDGRPVLCGLGDGRAADDEGRRHDLGDLASLIDELTPKVESIGAELSAIAGRCRDATIDIAGVAARLDSIHVSAPRRSRRVPPRRALAVSGLALSVLAALGWTTTRSAPPEPPEPPITTPIPTTTTVTRPPTVDTVPTHTTVSLLPEPGSIELTRGGRRYSVGRPGDVAVVGDWNCDGIDTPAVLRPTTGMVVVFAVWPAPDAAVEPDMVTTVIDGVGLERQAEGDCDRLRVRTPAGSQLMNPPEER